MNEALLEIKRNVSEVILSAHNVYVRAVIALAMSATLLRIGVNIYMFIAHSQYDL